MSKLSKQFIAGGSIAQVQSLATANSSVDAKAREGPAARKPVPGFLPEYMMKPEHIFDPERALRGLVRSGNVGGTRQLIEYYGLPVDKAATVRQAELNRNLLEAVDKLDVEGVRRALDLGASIYAASWVKARYTEYPRSGEWCDSSDSAQYASRRAPVLSDDFEKASAIMGLFSARGVSYNERRIYDDP